MPINLTVRRRDVDDIIADSPWELTLYRRGRTPDDADVSFTFDGTIAPMRNASGALARMNGQSTSGIMAWVLLAPYDTATIKTGDEIKGISPGGVTRKFLVLFAAQYDEKWEVVLEERE